ncbi:MAG: hypothetical protein H7282_04495 [Cytophagaceae bacterium]|nr:hypothetical protein [Cytophagaceae bacterium]
MKLHLTTLLLFLSLSLSSFGQQVMTWIPVYGIGNCKTMMNDATKFHWIKNGITHIGLQFWVPGDALLINCCTLQAEQAIYTFTLLPA